MFYIFIGQSCFYFNLKYAGGIWNSPISYLEGLYYKIMIGVLS